jgi:hypothetical protein
LPTYLEGRVLSPKGTIPVPKPGDVMRVVKPVGWWQRRWGHLSVDRLNHRLSLAIRLTS